MRFGPEADPEAGLEDVCFGLEAGLEAGPEAGLFDFDVTRSGASCEGPQSGSGSCRVGMACRKPSSSGQVGKSSTMNPGASK